MALLISRGRWPVVVNGRTVTFQCSKNISMFERSVVLLWRLLQIDQHLNGSFKRMRYKHVYRHDE